GGGDPGLREGGAGEGPGGGGPVVREGERAERVAASDPDGRGGGGEGDDAVLPPAGGADEPPAAAVGGVGREAGPDGGDAAVADGGRPDSAAERGCAEDGRERPAHQEREGGRPGRPDRERAGCAVAPGAGDPEGPGGGQDGRGP